MDFGLSDSQELLRRSIDDFLKRSAPMEKVREIMKSERAHDAELHAALGDQGVLGLMAPEEHGGSGLGLLDATIAAQELGRHATPLSYHSACVAAPLLLAGAGEPRQVEELLPQLVDGKATVTAILHGLEAEDGKLDGSVLHVPDAGMAKAIIVRSGDELHLVATDQPGISIDPLSTVDETRRVDEVRFSSVNLDAGTRMGQHPDPPALVARVRQAVQIALAADTLGACQAALRFAVDYSLQRQQFGRVIGSFQAVKHLCAETVAAIDPLQSLVCCAAFAWDDEQQEADMLAAITKGHAAEVGTQAVTTTTQVMGGIGFTHECDMHIWFKRVGYNRQMSGTPQALRSHAAALQHGAATAPTG